MEVKDKINIGLNILFKKQNFTYKTSLINKNIGEYNVFNYKICKSFSSKVEGIKKFADPQEPRWFQDKYLIILK